MFLLFPILLDLYTTTTTGNQTFLFLLYHSLKYIVMNKKGGDARILIYLGDIYQNRKKLLRTRTPTCVMFYNNPE